MNREAISIYKFIFEQLMPPIIRDSQLFSRTLLKIVFKKHYNQVIDFQNHYFNYPPLKYKQLYESLSSGSPENDDLTIKARELIVDMVEGKTIVDVGCGRGSLIEKIRKSHKSSEVFGVDIYVSDKVKRRYPHVHFIESMIENLPFKNKEFDTVICTHTLEHILKIHTAVNELRRICKTTLIIVVPKERPYKYTPNLHLHFFPYAKNFLTTIQSKPKSKIIELPSEFLYIETQ